MCTIVLSDILSKASDLPQAGSLFYDRIKSSFDKSETVNVDMENVAALPSIFLNVSIGRILEEFGLDRLKSGISFSHISKSQALRLKEYLNKFQ